MKEENAKLETKIGNLNQDVQSRTNEMNREIRRKERAEREVKQLRGDLEEKNKEIEELKASKSSIQITVERLEHSLNEQRTTNDGLVKQLVSFLGSSRFLICTVHTRVNLFLKKLLESAITWHVTAYGVPLLQEKIWGPARARPPLAWPPKF